MATLYLQYNIERFLTWPEVRDAGGSAAFASSISLGGIDIKTSFLSTVTGGFNLIRLVGMSFDRPLMSEFGFSHDPVGTTYWSYSSISVPSDTLIPLEYLTSGGGGGPTLPDDGSIDPAAPPTVDSQGYASLNWSAALMTSAQDVLKTHLKSEIKEVVKHALNGLVPSAFTQSVLDVGEVAYRLNNVGTAMVNDFKFIMEHFEEASPQEIQQILNASSFYAHSQFAAGFASIANQYYPTLGLQHYSALANSIKASVVLLSDTPTASGNTFTFVMGANRYMYSDANDILINFSGNTGIIAGLGNDIVVTGDLGDEFIDEGGNDRYSGNGGLDRAVFQGSRGSAVVEFLDGEINVHHGGETDLLFDVERLQFNDGWIGFDVDGTAGQAYRLYQAAFARTPDESGLGFWIRQMDAGQAYGDVAASFIGSNEFIGTYGTPSTISNEEFVNLLYNNILGRLPENDGAAFWYQSLANGWARKDVLAFFANSPENVALLEPVIADGIWFT